MASLLGGGRGGQRTGDDGPGGCCAVELGEQVGCRAGCWSPRPRPLPGCAADPPSQTPSPCSSAPMALTRRASGGGGVGAASSVRRQVGVPSGVAWPGRMGPGSGGGPGSWEGQGLGRRTRRAAVGPFSAAEPLDRGRGCGRRAGVTTTGDVSGDRGVSWRGCPGGAGRGLRCNRLARRGGWGGRRGGSRGARGPAVEALFVRRRGFGRFWAAPDRRQ